MKNLSRILSVSLALAMVMTLASCASTPAPAPEPAPAPQSSAAATESTPAPEKDAAPKEIPQGLKIGYFVPTYDNSFHQAHADYAKIYAKEKYGADVQVFDGKSDANVMAQNFDQAIAQGMNMVSTHIWQGDSIKLAAQEAIDNGIVVTNYFDNIPGLPVPYSLPGEATTSFEMGKIAAEQWKKAHPDKPIVFVAIGWPDNEVVRTGRTDPFAEGVLSVDPTAKDLGCMDASAGADVAYKVLQDLVQANPDINIIYSESADLTVGVMPALVALGRGTMKDGVPTTEIVCSVDCPETEVVEIYNPDSSLKMSMGLPPKETAQVRIDLMMDVYTGKTAQLDDKAESVFIPNKLVGYWSMTPEEAVKWYNEGFSANVTLK